MWIGWLSIYLKHFRYNVDWVAKYIFEGFQNIMWIGWLSIYLKDFRYNVDWVAKYVCEGFQI